MELYACEYCKFIAIGSCYAIEFLKILLWLPVNLVKNKFKTVASDLQYLSSYTVIDFSHNDVKREMQMFYEV